MATATYRRFTTTATTTAYVITEITPTTSHPMNWYGGERTRTDAWMAARAQALPVRYIGRDGESVTYGVVFSPEAFERACYHGYIAHGLSMTDGHYGPEKFEQWVIGFRKAPATTLHRECDVASVVTAALPAYLAATA